MANIQFYFSHDSNARNDEKIIRVRMKHGAAGYGVYFMLLERMREEQNYSCTADYDAIAFDLRVDTMLIKSVVEDFDLFTVENGRFYSKGFTARMLAKDEASNRRKVAGKKGNEVRWGVKNDSICDNNSSQCDGNAIENESQCDGNATENDRKKRKEKNIKENNNSSEDKSSSSLDGRRGFFNIVISLDHRSKLQEILKDESADDFSEAFRLCSWTDGEGREKANLVLAHFVTWAANKGKSYQPFYMAIQTIQGMESRGQIFPPRRDIWRAWNWVKGLTMKDQKVILSKVQEEEDLQVLNECIKECSKKKIDNPGRYVIAALNNK